MSDPQDARQSHPSSSLRKLHALVGLHPPRFSREQVAEQARVDLSQSSRWWRAMGFPEPSSESVVYSQDDVEIATKIHLLEVTGVMDDSAILRLARLNGAAFARLAEAQIALFDEAVSALLPDGDAMAPGDRLRVVIGAMQQDTDESPMSLIEDSLMYVWRRHMLAAIGRWMAEGAERTVSAVGFVDLSGFTRLANQLDQEELARVVDVFERVAFDVVSQHNGRVVKLIGDEVMFVHETMDGALNVVLALMAGLREVDHMPPVHAGLAFGETVSVGGDVFGPTVNLAARLTELARPASVLVPAENALDLELPSPFEWRRLSRPQHLKGIGSVKLRAIRWPDE